MSESRLARTRKRTGRWRTLLKFIAGLLLVAILAVVAIMLSKGDWAYWQARLPIPLQTVPATAPAEPEPPSQPKSPPDPALEPYLPLFQSADLVEAKSYSEALALLESAPSEGYWLYKHHLLRARALQGLGSLKQARTEAELAYSHATGPERTDTAILLAALREADGDLRGAADLLIDLIPSSALLFLGPTRAALIRRLHPVALRLNMADSGDRERLMELGELLYRYDYTNEGAALFLRSDWPEPISLELARQRIRARAFMGETDEAIEDLARLAAAASPSDAAWLHSLRTAYLWARGRDEEAKTSYEVTAAVGAGTYSGGQAVYRIAEPFLDADQVEPSEQLISQYAPAYGYTSGWQRGAWELFASAYATGETEAAHRTLALLEAFTPDDPQYLYWRYRLDREQELIDADLLTRLLTAFPSDYYALIARDRWPEEAAVAMAASSEQELAERFAALNRLAAAPADVDPIYQGADLTLSLALWRAGYFEAATGELRRLADGIGRWDLLYLLGLWEGQRGHHRESIGVMFTTAGQTGLAERPPEVMKGLYPAFYYDLVRQAAIAHGIDPYFALAIMREESAFEPGAHSLADARGLMQIIPGTGEGLAEQAGLANFKPEQLFSPEVAILLGVRYLASLLEQFDGDSRLASAAYNGGQGSVSRWLRITPTDDMAVFIERIPFPETRNYVKKVDQSYRLYKLLYQSQP